MTGGDSGVAPPSLSGGGKIFGYFPVHRAAGSARTIPETG